MEEMERQLIRRVLETVRDSEEALEVGESWILLVSEDELTDAEERRERDLLDDILSELDMSDKYAAVVQRPPTSQLVTGDSDDVELRRADGEVGMGIERIR